MVIANSINRTALAAIAALAVVTAGCGETVRQGRSPVQVTVLTLEAASGANPGTYSGTLDSDVQTMVNRTINGQQVRVPTVFNDHGRIAMSLLLKDPGLPGTPSVPSAINQVTFTRYLVKYRRADGRNTPGVDVPYPFDSAVTFTVPAGGTATAGFELVRHAAKEEAPLMALINSPVTISTVADISFFGRDQAGNEVTVTGSIGVIFGNFGDPS